MKSVTKRMVHVSRVVRMVSMGHFVWNVFRVNMDMNVKATVQILVETTDVRNSLDIALNVLDIL
jgi:hypothetical protein